MDLAEAPSLHERRGGTVRNPAPASSRPELSADKHSMHPGWPVIHWRPVVFVSSLFWFWYLAPAVVESRALERVIVLLVP